MTQFKTIDNSQCKGNPTVFAKTLHGDFRVMRAQYEPSHYDHVIHLGWDMYYGDVFKCWNNGNENNFTICFGTKGDENYESL